MAALRSLGLLGLNLLLVYRTLCVVFVEVPIFFGCPLSHAGCDAFSGSELEQELLSANLPILGFELNGAGTCKFACENRMKFDPENGMQHYLDIDPVIREYEGNLDFKIMASTLGFVSSPLFLVAVSGLCLRRRWGPALAYFTAGVYFCALFNFCIQQILVSPNPWLVIAYNSLDFVAIPALLCLVASCSYPIPPRPKVKKN